jgi:hypothetical protein
MALTGEPDPTTEPPPVKVSAGQSSWFKWPTVAIVGEICLVALFFLLGGLFKAYNLMTYAVAVGVATFVGGRVGGIRGAGQWLSAGIIIVLVSIVLAYLLFLAAVSQIQGP